MTLESIYYIGQTIAVGAILTSLAAIWIQMRQSIKMERAAAQRNVLERVSEWLRSVNRIENDEYDHFVLGLHDYSGSPPLTQMIADKHFSEYVFVCESALNMHKHGFFSDGTWSGIEGATFALLRTPGGAQWWSYAQHWLGSEIADHLRTGLPLVPAETPNFLDFSPAYRRRFAELSSLEN